MIFISCTSSVCQNHTAGSTERPGISINHGNIPVEMLTILSVFTHLPMKFEHTVHLYRSEEASKILSSLVN